MTDAVRTPVTKVVTHLEMTSPAQLQPAPPVAALTVTPVADPTSGGGALIRRLHDAIATPHHWSSTLWHDVEWRAFLARDELRHHVISVAGDPIGWACLAVHDAEDEVEIDSFGLVPDAVGHGRGGAALTEVVRLAWRHAPGRVWLHTASWDHPHALANYLARGFTVFRIEVKDAADPSSAPAVVAEPPTRHVRPAGPHDADAVTGLLRHLGYPRTIGEVAARLARLSVSRTDVVAVAVDAGTVVGFVSGHLLPLLAEAEEALMVVTSLAVDPAVQRGGVGRLLLAFVEHTARRRGCRWIDVSSGRRPERAAAHEFYTALGFEETTSVSARYRKDLEESTWT